MSHPETTQVPIRASSVASLRLDEIETSNLPANNDFSLKPLRKLDVLSFKRRANFNRMPALTHRLIAIVGRPNVGKSTLFNRLIGRRRSIVTDEPGITRDRIYGTTRWNGRSFDVVDTGGMVPGDETEIPKKIVEQAQVAIDTASLIFLVVDGRTDLGCTGSGTCAPSASHRQAGFPGGQQDRFR
jgi:GTP-binding protein